MTRGERRGARAIHRRLGRQVRLPQATLTDRLWWYNYAIIGGACALAGYVLGATW